MFALTFLGDAIVFVAGGALIWFFKPAIQKMVLGINKYSAMLNADAAIAKAKADAAIAALKKV